MTKILMIAEKDSQADNIADAFNLHLTLETVIYFGMSVLNYIYNLEYSDSEISDFFLIGLAVIYFCAGCWFIYIILRLIKHLKALWKKYSEAERMTKYVCRECSNPCILESNAVIQPTICPLEYTSISDDPNVNWEILKHKNNEVNKK